LLPLFPRVLPFSHPQMRAGFPSALVVVVVRSCRPGGNGQVSFYGVEVAFSSPPLTRSNLCSVFRVEKFVAVFLSRAFRLEAPNPGVEPVFFFHLQSPKRADLGLPLLGQLTGCGRFCVRQQDFSPSFRRTTISSPVQNDSGRENKEVIFPSEAFVLLPLITRGRSPACLFIFFVGDEVRLSPNANGLLLHARQAVWGHPFLSLRCVNLIQ